MHKKWPVFGKNLQNSPLPYASVPHFRSTWYSSLVSCARHSSSVFCEGQPSWDVWLTRLQGCAVNLNLECETRLFCSCLGQRACWGGRACRNCQRHLEGIFREVYRMPHSHTPLRPTAQSVMGAWRCERSEQARQLALWDRGRTLIIHHRQVRNLEDKIPTSSL